MGGALDPVCGREVDPLRARAVGIFGGITYYFCSAECKARFRDPRSAPSVVVAPPVVEKRAPRPTPARVEPVAASAFVQQTVSGIDAPSDPAPPERRRLRLGPLHYVALLVAAGVPATLVLTHLPQPSVVATPAPVAVPVVAPAVVAPPVTPKAGPEDEPPTVIADLQPPLKLGLRRFVDDGTVSLRLLVIDASNRAVPVTIAHQPGAASTVEEAIEPAAEFVSASAKPGTMFDARLETLDVRVERVADAVVAETRTGDAPFHVAVRIPLAADAQVRAAPFARKRYLSQETTP